MSNGISARIASGLCAAFALAGCGGGSDGGIGGGGPAPGSATAEFSTTAEALAIVREVAVADAAPEFLIDLLPFDELDAALNIGCSNPGGSAQIVPGAPTVIEFNNCIDPSDGLTSIEGTLNGTIEYEFGFDSQVALEFIEVSYRDFSWDSSVLGLFEIDGDVGFESVDNLENVVFTITSNNLIFSNDGFAISIPSLLVVNQFFDDAA